MSHAYDVSIVIPTYNRPDRIARCVEAIGQLEFGRSRFETIVVDDGSPTPIEPVIAEALGRLNGRYIRQKNQGPAAARNRGLDAASGRLVAFTDDDCRPDPRWLSEIWKTAQQHPKAAIGGTVINAIDGNICAETSQILIEYLYDYFGTRDGESGFFTSNNLTFPAAELRAMNGFDANFPSAAGEDREICERWRDHGYELAFARGALVNHEHNLSPRKFCRQQFNYGRGAFHFHQARRRAGHTEGVRVLPPSFYYNLVMSGVRKLGFVRGTAASALLALSQAANASGYFWERRRIGTDG